MRAGPLGPLGILLDRAADRRIVDASLQLPAIGAAALRQRDQCRARGCSGELRPVVLMLIERVVRLPESALPAGAHRDLGCQHGVRVDAGQGQVNEYPPHFAGPDELAVQGRQHRDGEHAAGGALEVRHFVYGYRGRGLAPAALEERIGAGFWGLGAARDDQGQEQREGFHEGPRYEEMTVLRTLGPPFSIEQESSVVNRPALDVRPSRWAFTRG